MIYVDIGRNSTDVTFFDLTRGKKRTNVIRDKTLDETTKIITDMVVDNYPTQIIFDGVGLGYTMRDVVVNNLRDLGYGVTSSGNVLRY
jgi:hypothetical protein